MRERKEREEKKEKEVELHLLFLFYSWGQSFAEKKAFSYRRRKREKWVGEEAGPRQ